MVFKTRKLNTETLAEYLSAVRNELGLSLTQVAEKSGVNDRFLVMLEQGNFTQLPPDTYVVGFLRQLADLYNTKADLLITQYKKERGIAVHDLAEKPVSRGFRAISGVAITPKLLGAALFGLFALSTAGYVILEVQSVNRKPEIRVVTPEDGSYNSGPFVRVSGSTNAGNQLSINSKDIVVNKNGDFETTVSIGGGQTVLELLAKNKFDKTTKKVITIMSEQASRRNPAAPLPAPVVLDIEADETVTLVLSVDGAIAAPEVLVKGERKQIGAEDIILLSTSDAGSTKVSVNGQRMGLLGRPGEVLNGIPFTAASNIFVNANGARN